jgi:hypothetical protein
VRPRDIDIRALKHFGARGLRVGWIAMNDDDRLPGFFDEDESVAPPDGTLVISKWNEPNQPYGFRARLIFRQGVDAAPSFVQCADPEEILDIVRRWLSAKSGFPTMSGNNG